MHNNFFCCRMNMFMGKQEQHFFYHSLTNWMCFCCLIDITQEKFLLKNIFTNKYFSARCLVSFTLNVFEGKWIKLSLGFMQGWFLSFDTRTHKHKKLPELKRLLGFLTFPSFFQSLSLSLPQHEILSYDFLMLSALC